MTPGLSLQSIINANATKNASQDTAIDSKEPIIGPTTELNISKLTLNNGNVFDEQPLTYTIISGFYTSINDLSTSIADIYSSISTLTTSDINNTSSINYLSTSIADIYSSNFNKRLMFICGESHGVPTINGNGNGNGNVFSFGGSGIASTTVGYGIPIPFSFNLVVISIAVNTVDTVSATFVVNRYNYGSSTPDLTPLSTIVLTSPVTTVAVNSSLNNGGGS